MNITKSSFLRHAAVATIALSVGLPMAAHAHRGWMLPSATVLSGENPWVTVDAAISNDVFYFEHNAMRLDTVSAIAPDGSPVALENKNTGAYRSTFDVKLTQKGTYKLVSVNDTLSASYKLGNENKRWRGTAENFAKEIPAEAKDVNVSRMQSRMEVFVSSGKPTDAVLKPSGNGLELAPITHPNDLFAGDTSNFRLLLDGKPAADIEVTLIPGGIRYRDQLREIKVKTDKDGKFSVKWPTAGMYWMSASNATPRTAGAADASREAQPVGTLAKPIRRVSYSATLEVLQP